MDSGSKKDEPFMIEPRSEKDEVRSEVRVEIDGAMLAGAAATAGFVGAGTKSMKEEPFIIEPRSTKEDPRSEVTLLGDSDDTEGSEDAVATGGAEDVLTAGC